MSSDQLGRKVSDYLSRLHMGERTELGPAELAAGYLRTYLTGEDPLLTDVWPAVGRHFNEQLESNSDPLVISASDVVAVSFLSVNLPAKAAWTILTDLRAQLTKTLVKIPDDLFIEDPRCNYELYATEEASGELAPLQELWDLLRRDPQGRKWGMGATTTSKLMARKRPGLVPVQDSVVVNALGAEDSTYWLMWWQAMHLTDDSGSAFVANFARAAREAVPAAANLSLLRVLDIVIWMNASYQVGRYEARVQDN